VINALYSVARIIIINLILSGDNAVVIGMAAHRLPHQQRRMAILFGGIVATILRAILTAVAALLLQIAGLQVVGGMLLIWIAFKLLKEEEESSEGIKIAVTMREAIVTILIADLIMSLDNVIAVAAASEGNLKLLLFGLILSMAIVMWMGGLVANLINRFWWLSYLGAAVIAWTGAVMIFEDPLVAHRAEWLSSAIVYTSAAIITVGVTAFAHWFHRMRD
jgi:YjbE family integral membrane protein